MSNSIRRILIANRGEIAVRVIRACQELDIETIQVYTEVDRDSLAVQIADQSVCIGAARSDVSYLNPAFLLSAALTRGADAVHPGYGFLSENADFAEMCEKERLIFIGPKSEVIRRMGDKAEARRAAREAGVPITPGSLGTVADPDEAGALAADIGYPVILKAVAGGGGRGMRIVHQASDLAPAFHDAAREAKAAFGDGGIYLEKYLTEVRHIEVQVLADDSRIIHLGERDCSIQRRNQKLLEESPSPALSPELRVAMGQAAVQLCKQVGYTNAGTIEFILHPGTGHFYFMEMNTRIQVEHPVTEMVTGVDLVRCQIEIASGKPIPFTQDQVKISGHAIECRINAEDYNNNFMPCPGLVDRLHLPGGPGIRIDTHLKAGYRVPPHYDSLLAKLVCWGETRAEAIARVRRALRELEIHGITTTASFHELLLADDGFQTGNYHTRYIEESFLSSPRS